MKTFVVILVFAVNLVNAGYIPQQNQVEETKLVTRPRTVVEKSGLARSDFDRQLKTSIVICKNSFLKKKHSLNNWILSDQPFSKDH